MRRKLNIALFILAWLGCGMLGSVIGIEILRIDSCIRGSDLCLLGIMSLTGPFNLIITPVSTGVAAICRRLPNDCILEKHGDGE